MKLSVAICFRAPADLYSLEIKLHFIVTDALQQGASQFEQQAGKLKRKFWWKNLKVYKKTRKKIIRT